MSVEITSHRDPRNPNRTIYGLVGPTFESVQLAIENLMEPDGPHGSIAARFSIPFHDRPNNRWYAHGTVERFEAKERTVEVRTDGSLARPAPRGDQQ